MTKIHFGSTFFDETGFTLRPLIFLYVLMRSCYNIYDLQLSYKYSFDLIVL